MLGPGQSPWISNRPVKRFPRFRAATCVFAAPLPISAQAAPPPSLLKSATLVIHLDHQSGASAGILRVRSRCLDARGVDSNMGFALVCAARGRRRSLCHFDAIGGAWECQLCRTPLRRLMIINDL